MNIEQRGSVTKIAVLFIKINTLCNTDSSMTDSIAVMT
jgi:hypothetical protein